MCRLFRSNGIGSSTYSAKAGRTFEKFGFSFLTRAYNGWEVVAFAINLENRKSTSESGREHLRSSLNGWGSRKEVTVIYMRTKQRRRLTVYQTLMERDVLSRIRKPKDNKEMISSPEVISLCIKQPS